MCHLRVIILLHALLYLTWTPLASSESWSDSVLKPFKSAYHNVDCKLWECCDKPWLTGNFIGLRTTLRQRVYGQPLVQQTIFQSLVAHYENESSDKALVLSFHGPSGVGKNYVATMIAQNLYEKGMDSAFVHLFIGSLHLPHSGDIDIYKQQLKSWIIGNVTICERSLFIFDEVDMMDARVMEAIKPFVDYHQHVSGVNFRKSIFIFISNIGSADITQKSFEYSLAGKPRGKIPFGEMNEITKRAAYNEQGGLRSSRLIDNHLIDYFIPFLPLEREQILLCIRDYSKLKSYELTEESIKEIANTIQLTIHFNSMYAASGCKGIKHKVEMYLHEKEEGEDSFRTEL